MVMGWEMMDGMGWDGVGWGGMGSGWKWMQSFLMTSISVHREEEKGDSVSVWVLSKTD